MQPDGTSSKSNTDQSNMMNNQSKSGMQSASAGADAPIISLSSDVPQDLMELGGGSDCIAQETPQRFELARKFTLSSYPDALKINMFVDAKDTVGFWCTAQVIDQDIDYGTVKIHFEGWSSKHDLVLRKNSVKMAPFRSHSKGYSGQPKNAYRDFKLNQAYNSMMEKKVKEVIQSRFTVFKSAHECIQFIRGELYFYVDSLITLQNVSTKNDLPGILDFIRLVMHLGLVWLEIFPHYYKAHKECQQYPMLYQVDLPAAISSCGYELMELFGKIWKACPRARAFFALYKSEFIHPGSFVNQTLVREHGLVLSLTNIFGELNGFERIINVIKGDSNFSLPLELTGNLLMQFRFIAEYCEQRLSVQFTSAVSQTLMQRLDNMSEIEIKDVEKSVPHKLIKVLEVYIKQCQPQTNEYEISEMYELRLAQKYLMSSFFDKKIRGINEFKEIFTKIDNSNRYNQSQIQKNDLQFTQFLTYQTFSNWMIQNRLLEYIYIENPHPEIIKRSLQILYVRCIDQENPVPKELVDEIWKCASQKHEEIVKATLSVLQDIFQFLPLEIIEMFYQHIRLIPDSSFDEKHVIFLKNYSEGAIAAMIKQRNNLISEQSRQSSAASSQQSSGLLRNLVGGKKGQAQQNNAAKVVIDASKYVDLSKFWTIAQDSNKNVNQKTKELALNSLIDILSKYYKERGFENLSNKIDFMNMALTNIVHQNSMYISVNFLKNLILTFPRDGNYQRQFNNRGQEIQVETREHIIQQLLEQDILSKVIGNATNYMQLASSAAKKLRENEQESLHKEKLLGDNWIHKEYIDLFMDFIEFMITNSKGGNLNFKQLSALFEIMVTNAISDYEAKNFFIFLTKENPTAVTRERRYLLDEKRRSEVFMQIMCNQEKLDCAKLGQEGFSCFKLLFLNVNAEQGHLIYHSSTELFTVIDIIRFQKLLGFDTLWSIAIENKIHSVCQESRNFLVDIYLRTKVESKHKMKFVESFLARVEDIHMKLNRLQPSAQLLTYHMDMRLNWTRLIRTFIQRFDFDHFTVEDISKYDEQNNIEIQINLTLEDQNVQTETITVNRSQKIWQIVLQISKKFKLKIPEFKIMTKNGPLDEKIYYDEVSQYKINSLVIQKQEEKILNMENPRRIIGQDQVFLEKLIQLLELGLEERVQREIISLIHLLPVNLDMRLALQKQVDKIDQSTGDCLAQLASIFGWDQNTSRGHAFPPRTYLSILLLHSFFSEYFKFINSSKEVEQRISQAAFDFMKQFMSKDGFLFLTQIFTHIKKENLEESMLRHKTLTLLIEILYQNMGQKLYPYIRDQCQQEQVIFDLFSQNLTVIQSYISSVYNQQNTRQVTTNKNQRVLKNDIYLINISLQLMQKMVFLQPKLVQVLYAFQGIQNVFQVTFTQLDSERIQQSVSKCLFDICKRIEIDLPRIENISTDAEQMPLEIVQKTTSFFFMKLFWKQYLPHVLLAKQNTIVMRELFSFVNKILLETQICKRMDLIQPEKQFIVDLVKMIQERPILEKGSSSLNEDMVLTGLFQTLRSLLIMLPQARTLFDDKNAFLYYLLHDCLLRKETDMNHAMGNHDVAYPPKCKTRNSRQSCLALVREMCIDNREGIQVFVKYMQSILFSSSVSNCWRTPRNADWNITTTDKIEKSSTGFVGLKNIGCICYMNSIMQQLYMIPSFRKAMIEVEDKNHLEPESENVLLQIKKIFGSLMELEKQYFNMKKFCYSFKDIDGSPIDPMVQRDGDEFFNMLIDRIENLIKGTKEEKVMKNLFYGVFANEFICKGCPHKSEREEPFMAIPIQVKDKNSIQESLESFVQGEMLEGDNAYHCEKCDKKRDTLKRCSIKRLPNVLILELKRFEFDFETMQKIKLNDFQSFPMVLDMREYSQQQISKNDLLKEMEEQNLTVEDLSEDQLVILNRDITEQYFQYKLMGIVVHNGTSESGHYYSFIKDRENINGQGSWYEFNDKNVTHFNQEDIPNETYGGENENWEQELRAHSNDPAMQQILQSQGRAKTKNAYILIYERDCFIDQEKFNEFTDDQNIVLQSKQAKIYQQQSLQAFNSYRLPATVSSQIQIPPNLHEQILQKNKRFWLTRFIFHKQFLEQSLEIFKLFNFSESMEMTNSLPQDEQNYQLEVLKYIVCFTLTVAFRAKTREYIPDLVRIIRKGLKSHYQLAVWFCRIFSHQDIIKEFLLDCTVQDMARFSSGLLKTAMQTLYTQEKQSLLRFASQIDQQNIVSFVQATQSSSIVKIQTDPNNVDSNAVITSGTPGATPMPPEDHNCNRQVHSLCNNVQQIFIKNNHTSELPVLVVLANSLLHFQISNELISHFSISSNLHSVVFHFANLGAVARHYMLRLGTLQRLLKIVVLNSISATDVVNMCTQVPLFVTLHHQEEGLFLSPNDADIVNAKLVMKERQTLGQNAPTPKIFLIATISQLVRACQFVNNQSSANGNDSSAAPPQIHSSQGPLFNGKIPNMEGGHNLDKEELDLLINYISNQVWWKSSAQNLSFVRNSVAKMFAHVAFDNSQFSHAYIAEMFKTINETNFMVVRKYERPLLLLVNIQDAYQKERITRVLNHLYEVFRKNKLFWKFCDQLIELTLKLTQRCPMFAYEMSKSSNLFKMIEQITKENPSFPYDQQRMKIFRDGWINWQNINNKKNIVNQTRVEQISQYSKTRLARLDKAIMQGKSKVEATAANNPQPKDVVEMGPDSDNDFYGVALQEGDAVDAYFDRNIQQPGWYQARVIQALDEIVKVQTTLANGSVCECWVELESDKLAQLGCYTQNDKYDNFQYFRELYKLIEPFAKEPSSSGSSSTKASAASSSQKQRR